MSPDLDARVRVAFVEIHHRVFLGDPAANPPLKVEVLGSRTAGDTTTLVVVTPWTINGLVFAPAPPVIVRLAGPRRPVHALELPSPGRFGSINLVPDVSGPARPGARPVATSWLAPFRSAVADATVGAAP